MNDQTTLSALPYSFARRHKILIECTASGAYACVHQSAPSLQSLLEVQRLLGLGFPLREVDPATFQEALTSAYQDSAVETAEAAALVDSDLASLAESVGQIDDLLDQNDNAPVVQLINAILLQAIKEGASDIHLETQEKRILVRFRVDGVLRDVLEPKRELGPLLVSRIKVMARLDIAEKRQPHDGRVTLSLGGHEIDIRVSTVPAQHAERVVMRILDRGADKPTLTSLGMQPHLLSLLERKLERPNGMLLVTGPTGSGKTTTLYAALNRLNDRTRNIMTVEDPIEYAVEGIGQIQVNPRTGLSFANGLRSILRQDPDVIMIGEIRDGETAQIAVQSSMTGHFVLSTLHTNSAIGGIARLIDMGVERFLLAPVLTAVAAQRLVRRLCVHCAEPYSATSLDAARLGLELAIGETFFRPIGCPHCRHEGYRGRIAIYEIVDIDDPLQALIHNGAPEAELTWVARLSSPSLIDDGLARIRAGVTSVDEIARVVSSD